MERNRYPVKIADFTNLIKQGTYTIFYAILDDRLHFEMPIENAVFITQRFFTTIDEEMKLKAENYNGDQYVLYIKRIVGGIKNVRFYPTEKEIRALKQIKLYSKLVIQKVILEDNKTKKLMHQDKLRETDTHIETYNGDKLVLVAEKV